MIPLAGMAPTKKQPVRDMCFNSSKCFNSWNLTVVQSAEATPPVGGSKLGNPCRCRGRADSNTETEREPTPQEHRAVLCRGDD